MKNLADNLTKAFEQRRSLLTVTDAMRLVNGKGDGLDGLLIDRYNKHVQIQFLSEHWQEHKDKIVEVLTSLLPVEYLIIKARRGLKIDSEVVIGKNPCTMVQEHGIKFEVDLNDGLNCGLFLDMRHNRRMVGQFANGKKMLNTFSYTCSFGVHARACGAAEVVNTDISKKTLDRGRDNYELNALPVGQGEFVKTDSVAFLQRAFKKSNGFDVVVLDPPSFARHEGKTFQVKADLPKLMALGIAVLNPGGAMLVSTNYSEMSHADLERLLAKGLNGRRVDSIKRLGQDKDFVGSNSFKESFLVGLWVVFN